MTNKRKIGTITGLAIVVANMVGTGAFTSIGFQVKELDSNLAILTLWFLGGIMALAGAFSYAEIVTFIKRSGGEYAFLSSIYHPMVGYLAGWISITAGFGAPIALSAIAAVTYFPHHQGVALKWLAVGLVGCITLVHTKSIRLSAVFQNIVTVLKVILILAFIVLGLRGTDVGNSFVLDKDYVKDLFSPAFAVALIYVGYSYSGWNAAAYISDDFRNARKSLPVALVGGSLLVMLLYMLLQYVFLKNVPVQQLEGRIDVGVVVMQRLLGGKMAELFGMMVSFLLVSSISAMVWVGARVTSSIAQDYSLWKFFRTAGNAIPSHALWLQFLVASILILTGTFEQIMVYCGFLLNLSTLLVVLGVFIVRKKGATNANFKSPLYPIPQILYIAIAVWVILYSTIQYPKESLFGLLNLLVGWVSFLFNKRLSKETNEKIPWVSDEK